MLHRIACFAELAARREKNDLVKLKILKFLKNFNFSLPDEAFARGRALKHGVCLVFASFGVHGMVFDVPSYSCAK